MFSYLKSKKAFTLVELMIVVVIMAILVAVAVPIFSAVTSNARKKTCIANRRSITEMLTNYGMMNENALNNGTIEITSNAEGDGIESIEVNDVCSEEVFSKLFEEKNKPVCPVGGAIMSVEVTKNGDGSYQINATCSEHD